MRFLAAACALMLLSGACSDDTSDAGTPPTDPPATDAPTTDPPTTDPPTMDPPTTDPPTTTEFEVDDQGTPSPASVEVDRAFRSVPGTHADCGSVIPTSGWPTTAPPRPDATDCIVAAAGAGEPTQYSGAARDFAGGMEGTIIRVDGPGDIVRIDYSVTPDGTVTSTRKTCRSLSPAAEFDPRPRCD